MDCEWDGALEFIPGRVIKKVSLSDPSKVLVPSFVPVVSMCMCVCVCHIFKNFSIIIVGWAAAMHLYNDPTVDVSGEFKSLKNII